MTTREKNLAIVLPAIGVLAIYGLFPFRYQQARLTKATADAKGAQARAASPAELQAQALQLATLQRELDADAKSLAAIDEKWKIASGRAGVTTNRPVRIERLNQLLAKSNLRVIESRDADASGTGKATPALDALVRDLAEVAENQQPRRRLVRFYGTYNDVFATLGVLARGEVMAVPLGLTMQEAQSDTTLREWTLQVWV